VDVVPAHRVDAVRLPVHYVLVVKEELVGLHELRIALGQLVGDHAVLQDLRELQVVVRDRLPAKHDHSVSIDHVETDKPDLLLSHDVYNLPVAPLRVELLYRGTIGECLISDGVYVPLGERTAIRPSDGLAQLRQSLLPLGSQIEGLALPEVGALQGSPDDVDVILLLGDPKVDPVIHHLPKGFELTLRDIKLNDLRAGHVTGPIEALGLVTPDNQDVLLVYDHDLALRDFPIVDLEGGPAEGFEVVECMLVQLREVEQLLREAVRLARFGHPLVEELLEALILRRNRSQLIRQVGQAVMVQPRVRVAHVLAVGALEDNRGAVALVLEDLGIGSHLLAPSVAVATLELDLSQQISCDSVNLVKLRVRPAEWAVIRILRKPVTLAVGTDGFLTDFALEWVLEYVIAHPTDELGEESRHICLILDVVLLVHVASVLRG